MGKTTPYQATGFRLDGPLENGDVDYCTAAAVTIKKGDAIHDDGAGLATNAVTAFAATFKGIAGADCASGGQCMIIKPLPKNVFWVAVDTGTTLAAITDIGEILDLQACNTVDTTDNTVVAWGFTVEDIDVSAEAIAASALGFVKGRFWPQPQ